MGGRMIIYKATNNINGKVYIGQTVGTLKKRKYNHFRNYKGKHITYFFSALCKYGKDNFSWEVLCICYSINVLNEMEKHYIAFYNSMNNGYNCTSGGDSYIFSKESCKKVSDAQIGEKHWKYGVAATPEERKRLNDMRPNMKGENNPMYGVKKDPKSLARAGAKHKELWETAEYQEKQRLAQIKRKKTMIRRGIWSA